ncbi:MAG: hypothetical protein ACREVN_06830 [Gammaproteobacteria bacterium]
MEGIEETTPHPRTSETSGGRSGGARRAGEKAERLTSQARERSREELEKGKRAAGSELADVAEAVDDAAAGLEAKNRTSLAAYARQTADSLWSAAERMQHGDVDSMIADLRDTARRNPALFLAGAALAGFVCARFAKASSKDIEDFKAGFSGDGHGST